MTVSKGLTPLAAFIEEELDRLGWSQFQLEVESGIPDSTISRIRNGQEAKPSQIARFAKAFGCSFGYIIRRTGYEFDMEAPSAEAHRLGAIMVDNPELSAMANGILRLSLPSRRAVARMIQALLEDCADPPAPPEPE